MNLNPVKPRPVRTITTHEGKFLNLQDMKQRLLENGTSDFCMAFLIVGRDRGDDLREIMRRAVGGFVASCADELE